MGSENDKSRLEQRLPETGFVRLSSILAPAGPIPVSRSSWFRGIAAGYYPKPVRLGARTSAWRVEDISALIADPANQAKHRGRRS